MSTGLESMQWPRCLGTPEASARLRVEPEDFIVDEIAGFEPDGEGDHVLLRVRKRGSNTAHIAGLLARLAGVRPVDVGYAGMKDRHAVTTQWFSVALPGREEPDWSALDEPGVEFLERHRHRRKLRRGALAGNRFSLLLRDLSGDRAALELRLTAIAERGAPNYFGEQRFGRDGGNVEQARRMFAGRRERNRAKRGIYLSAARSFLFNQVLAARVAADTWDRPLPGEVLQSGDGSLFVAEEPDRTLERRVADRELHPTGPMWGRGRVMSRDAALALESAATAPWPELRDGLEHAGLKQERRALPLAVEGLAWRWEEAGLRLEFELPAGSYATAVVRELLQIRG